MRYSLVLTALALAGCTKAPPAETPPLSPPEMCGVQSDGARVFRVLHLNDIYRIEGLADGRGGLARVRTLREKLESDCTDSVLLTHAGDALFPSLLSRVYKGEQMVDVLNVLDGAAEVDDPRMLFTIGNHEFDKSKLKDAPLLTRAIDGSEFTWLDTNIAWKAGDDGPLIASDNLATVALLDLGGVKVGVFGLTTNAKVPAYVEHIDTNYLAVARTQTAALREAGAEVVIGLTHIDAPDDVEILEQLAGEGPDLILGGHDHALQTTRIQGRALLKGDADAARVRVVEVRVEPDGTVDVRADPGDVTLGPDEPPPDPLVQARVEDWLQRFDDVFCGEDGPSCLDQTYTHATATVHAEETSIRRFETNLGAWLADRMVQTFADEGAQAAVINSGALRLNQDISPNTPITRQTLEELFAYSARMSLIEVSGQTLQAMLDRSTQDWTGQGHWLQVSGVAFRHRPPSEEAHQASIQTSDGWTPLDPDARYRVVTVRYLLDRQMGDQDGYTMISLDDVMETSLDGTDLKPIVRDAWTELGDEGFGPDAPGRVCTPERDGPCVLDAD